MTDTRREGRGRRGSGAQGRAGTRLKVDGDVVMADADEHPKRQAQGQRRGRGEMGRQSTGGAGECGGSNGAGGRETYRGYGEQRGAEREADGMQYQNVVQERSRAQFVTRENGRRWIGAALCPSGAARCQGSDLQERRTGRRIQYSDTLVPGSWLMV